MTTKLTTHRMLFLTAIGLSVLFFTNTVKAQSKQETISSLLVTCLKKDGLHYLEAMTNPDGKWRMEKDSAIAIVRSIDDSVIKNSVTDIITLYTKDTYLPLKLGGTPFVIRYQNEKGKEGLAFTGMLTGTTYNNLKLDSKQRAQRAIDDFLYDFLKKSYGIIDKSSFESIAVHIMYLTNNFATNKSYDIEREAIVISIDKSFVKKFVENQITDTELIDNSNIYILTSESESYRKTVLK